MSNNPDKTTTTTTTTPNPDSTPSSNSTPGYQPAFPPARYRKRPLEVQAIQYDGSNSRAKAILDWVADSRGQIRRWEGQWAVDGNWAPTLLIDTMEGTMAVTPTDWVIRGVQGEFYPCSHAVFMKTYELVDPVDQDPVDQDPDGEST